MQSDLVLLVGTNPRWESPVFNARLRKMFLDGTQVGGACACLFGCRGGPWKSRAQSKIGVDWEEDWGSVVAYRVARAHARLYTP